LKFNHFDFSLKSVTVAVRGDIMMGRSRLSGAGARGRTIFVAALGFAMASAVGRAAVVSETWTGSDGAAWPSQWEITLPGADAVPVVSIQSNTGNVQSVNGGTQAVSGLIKSSVATFTDSVQDMDISIYNSAYLGGGFLARVNGDSYYRGWLTQYRSKYWNLYINKVVDGTSTPLVTENLTIDGGARSGHLTFLVQDVGSQTQLSLTYADSTLPKTTVSYTDDSDPLAGSGQVGVYGQVASNTARYVRFDNYTADLVPEPGTVAVLGMGLAGLVLKRRRRA
jgi:hypothetical protein